MLEMFLIFFGMAELLSPDAAKEERPRLPPDATEEERPRLPAPPPEPVITPKREQPYYEGVLENRSRAGRLRRAIASPNDYGSYIRVGVAR